MSRWPDNTLAIKRTLKVKGRIKFLINSIINMKKIKSKGVPKGIIWITNPLKDFTKLNKFKLNHNEKDKNKTKHKWEVRENL